MAKMSRNSTSISTAPRVIPTYMKYLYKYPQREYPYSDLVETNARGVRGKR
jgi:hypothetical protein